MHIIGLPKRNCLQCGIEYKPQTEKHVICKLCEQALAKMPDVIQAFMARMARRIGDLEDLVLALKRSQLNKN